MTNFGTARIRQDSLTHLQLQKSILGGNDLESSESAGAPVVCRRPTGTRKVLKEQGRRILEEAARKRSELPPEEIARALETFRFAEDTNHHVRQYSEEHSNGSVIPVKEEVASDRSDPESIASDGADLKRKRRSLTRSLSSKLTRQVSNAGLPRVLVDAIPSSMRPVSLFIASLGNPPPYHSTRHSAGHIALKHLQSRLNLPSFTLKSRPYGGGHVSEGADVGRPEFTLWQSPSLMNVSGPPLLKAWRNFLDVQSVSPNLPVAGLVILHDEMEIDSGKVKVKRGNTSPRGHNGLKSVKSSLQSAGLMDGLGDRYIKVGIGIGRPSGGTRDTRDVSAYVLGQLTAKEKDGLEDATSELERALYQEMARISQSAR